MAYEQFAEVYDRLMEDMPYDDWLRFARECWGQYGQPTTVVDLGCGTGTLSIPLAQAGYDVIGIDLSEDMLAIAQQKAIEASQGRLWPTGGGLQWIQQDMREWEIGRPADAVISFCDCMNYLLEEDDLAAAFKRAYEGLKSGGTFLFDVHTPYQLKGYAEAQPFLLNEDDIAYIWTSEFDEERCEIEHALTIFAKDEGERFVRVDEMHVQRAYPLETVQKLLRDAGFRDISMYADFTWKKPSAETQRAFFIAVK